MNTVLDDNKKLCLPNSEIIQVRELLRIDEEGDALRGAAAGDKRTSRKMDPTAACISSA